MSTICNRLPPGKERKTSRLYHCFPGCLPGFGSRNRERPLRPRLLRPSAPEWCQVAHHSPSCERALCPDCQRHLQPGLQPCRGAWASGAFKRRKHTVGQSEIASVSKVFGDVPLAHLRIGKVIARNIPVKLNVEPVHLAAVDCRVTVEKSVAHVPWRHVGSLSEWNHPPGGDRPLRLAVSPRESPKVLVE